MKKCIISFFWFLLPQPASYYDFKIFGLNSSVTLQTGIFKSRLLLSLPSFSIVQKFFGLNVAFKTKYINIFRQASRMGQLIASANYYLVLVVYDRTETELILLRKMKDDDAINTKNIYPNLKELGQT